MKTLILLAAILLTVGCGKGKESQTKTKVTNPDKELTLREKVVGTYEAIESEDTYRIVLLENGISQDYRNGTKELEGKWKIVDGKIHMINDDTISVIRINKDRSITDTGYIDETGRMTSVDWGDTFKRINGKDKQIDKESPKETPSKGDDNNSTTAKPDRKLTAEEEKVVGTYESKVGEDTLKYVLLESGIAEGYTNGKKEFEGKWKKSEDVELYIVFKNDAKFGYRINKNGSLTDISRIDKGGDRIEIPKGMQSTWEK